MALVLQDRVRETSTTTGTGTVTLGGAYDGYRTFASCVPDGSVVYYAIQNTGPGMEGEWEVGYGTFTLSGTTLSRTTVFSSSNADSLVNFSAGTKQVFITYPSEKAIYEEVNGTTLINAGPITVVGAGVVSIPNLPAELGKFIGNVDSFAQIYTLNQSATANASADFVAYNDLTTDGNTNFIDMGINSSNYGSASYPIFTPGSGYVFNDGGTLFIGSQTDDVQIFAGAANAANVVVTLGTNKSANFTGNVAAAGTFTANGAATFGSTVLLNADPTLALQAATKQYVDQAVSTGLHVHSPVRVATTGNLTATYSNGSSGVGATLTNSGAQAALSIDGISLSTNDRVLVWQQSTQTQNGVYVVTTVGSGSTNWVLTRASDADTYAPQSDTGLGGGDYFYVQEGTTGAGDSYVCTNDSTITFGTTNITFTQFSGAITYVGGTNINVNGQTISVTGTIAATNGGTGANTVTTGDLLYGSGTNTWGKLAKGSAYRSLVMDASGTNVEWNAIALNQGNAVSGTLDETNGGTGLSTYTTGDTVYASATNTLSKLGGNTTTTKKFLQQTGDGVNSAAPAWGQPAASDITGLAPSATTDTTNASNITSGTLPNARLVSVPNSALANSSMTINGTAISLGGSGTVTAAAGTLTGTSLPVTVTGSSLTSVGTVTSGTWSGSFGAVSGANLTTLNGSNISSGTVAPARLGSGTPSSANYLRGDGAWTAVPSPNNGTLNMGVSGTGLSGSATFTADQSGTSTFTVTSNATSLNTASAIVARDASGNFSAGTITATLSGNASTATSATSATTATTATNLANGGAGQIPYNTGSGATAFLAAGTAGYILQSNGTSAPSWIANQTGTVTSVAASAGTGISVSGSPITSSGTLTITNTGVTSIGGSGGITLSASTGSVTASPTSGYNGYGVRTVSTASPTGGSDGDVWYKY